MSDLLIPFGIHRETGNIVEPEDAAKGRACDCLCPGCKAPLLCRHPKDKRDHFAHDSRHKNARPQNECPFSSAVAVAMMVREMAPEFVGKLLVTPELRIDQRCHHCQVFESIQVTRSARNVIDAAEVNVSMYGHRVDLKLTVAGFTLLVDLVYKGKPKLQIDEYALQADKVALLELNCDRFSLKALKRNHQIRFSQAIIGFFLNARHKRWRFHPRTRLLREQFQQAHRHPRANEYRTTPRRSSKRETKAEKSVPAINPPGGAETMLQHPERKPEPGGEGFRRPPPEFEERVPPPRATRQKQEKPRDLPAEQKPVVKYFECVLCHLCWEHQGPSGWTCPNCASHLYAREITLK